MSFIRRLWPFVAAVLGWMAAAPPARACFGGSSRVRETMLGVSPDGSFIVAADNLYSHADEPGEYVILYDPQGVEVERLSATTTAGAGDAVVWIHKRNDVSRMARLAAAGELGLTMDELKTQIIRKLGLTPLVSAAPMRHVETPVRCGSLELSTPDGWVRVAEVGDIHLKTANCVPVTASAFTHPASAFVFMRTQWAVRQELDHVEADDFRWFPERRVRGLRAAGRGEQALKAGHEGLALALFEDALRLAPEYYPSRHGLVEAFARTNGAWHPLRALLETPFPKGQTCIGWYDHPAPQEHLSVPLPWAEASSLGQPDPEKPWPWENCSVGENYLHHTWAPPATAPGEEAAEAEAPKDSEKGADDGQETETTGTSGEAPVETATATPESDSATAEGESTISVSESEVAAPSAMGKVLQDVLSFAGWLVAAIFGAAVALAGSRHGARIARGNRSQDSGSPYRDPPS